MLISMRSQDQRNPLLQSPQSPPQEHGKGYRPTTAGALPAQKIWVGKNEGVWGLEKNFPDHACRQLSLWLTFFYLFVEKDFIASFAYIEMARCNETKISRQHQILSVNIKQEPLEHSFQCSLCPESFEDANKLGEHQEMHLGNYFDNQIQQLEVCMKLSTALSSLLFWNRGDGRASP